MPVAAIDDATNKWPPETKREWGTKIRMSDDVIAVVTEKWPRVGLPGSGKPIWKSQSGADRAAFVRAGAA